MTPKPIRTLELTFDCEDVSYRIEVKQYEKHAMMSFARDGKALQFYQFYPFPWETARQVMGFGIGYIRQSACSEIRRVLEGMMGELHRVKTLEVA